MRRLFYSRIKSGQGVVWRSEYGGVQHRGNYCKLDWSKSAVPGHLQDATADPVDILRAEDQCRLTGELLMKPREEWPNEHNLAKVTVHLGQKWTILGTTREYGHI